MGISGGWARPLRRLSILVDVQDQATAQLAALNGASMKLSNIFGETATKGKGLNATLAGVAIAAGASAIAMRRITRVGAELDSTFATIEVAAQATDEEMREVVETTQQIGAEMPATLAEVARAMELFTYAGFDAAEAVEAADTAVQLAIAGQMDMEQAVQTLTTSMNAFNLEAEQTDAIAATLASTFATSALEIEELGNAMRYASSQASALGYDMLELSTAIGAMADQGLRGTMAGTSLNQAMSAIVDPTDQAAEAMNAVGLAADDFTDEEGNMISMIDMFRQIDEHTRHLGDRDRQMWMERVFGTRAGRAINALMNDLDSFEEDLETGARAQLLEMIEDLDELDEVAEARREILMETEDLEWALDELSDLEDDEILEWAAQVDADVDLDDFETWEDVIEQGREWVDEGMGEEELMKSLQALFRIEEEAARVLAEDIMSDRPMEEIAEDFSEAVTHADLESARLDTVAGRLDYLRGSMTSIMYTIYTGFRPALELVLDLFIAWADLLNAHPILLRAVGVAMFGLVGALAALAFTMVMNTIAAANFAGSIRAVTGALTAKMTPLLGSIAMHLQGIKVVATATAANQGYAAASLFTAKAIVAKTIALAKFLVLAAPITALFLGIGLLLVAVRRNWLGLGDAVEHVGGIFAWVGGILDRWVATPLRWVWTQLTRVTGAVRNAIDWFRNLGTVGQVFITMLIAPFIAVAGPIATFAFLLLAAYVAVTTLADGIRWLVGLVRDLFEWYENLGAAGQLVIGILFPMIPILYTLVQLFGLLADGARWLYGIFGDLPGAIYGVGQAFAGFIEGIGERVYGFFARMGEGIDEWTRDIERRLIDGIRSIPGRIRQFAYERIREAGESIPRAIASGIRSAPNVVMDALRDRLGPLGKLLPSSDAEYGPLRALSVQGAQIVRTIADGIGSEEGTLASKMSNALEYLSEEVDMDEAKAGDAMARSISTSVKESHSKLEMIGGMIEDRLPGYFDNFYDAVDRLEEPLEDALELARDLIDEVGILNRLDIDIDDMSGVLDQLEERGGVIGAIVGGARTAWEMAGQLEEAILESLPDGDDAREAGERTREWLEDIFGDLEERLGDAVDDAETAGQEIAGTSVEGMVAPAVAASGARQLSASRERADLTRRFGETAGPLVDHDDLRRGGDTIYHDNRRIEVHQDPHIDTDIHGASGLDQTTVQRMVERGMDQASANALDDFIDFLTLGGPGALGGDTTGGMAPGGPAAEQPMPGEDPDVPQPGDPSDPDDPDGPPDGEPGEPGEPGGPDDDGTTWA